MQIEAVKLNLAADTLPDQLEILTYLAGGEVVIVAAGMQDDVIDQAKKSVVPVGLKTDGRYYWPLSLEYYMKNHWVGVTGPFLSEIRKSGYQAPKLTPERLAEIRSFLANQPE